MQEMKEETKKRETDRNKQRKGDEKEEKLHEKSNGIIDKRGKEVR